MTSAGNNNLHGTLRVLSKKYCRKAGHKRGLRAGIPTIIRKSLKPRSDKLLQVVVHETESGKSGAGKSSQATEMKGPLSPEAQSKDETETSAANTLAVNNTGAGTAASSGASNEPSPQPKESKNPAASTKTTTITTTTVLLHPKDLEQYQEAEKVQQKALKKIERARQKVYNDQVQQVWGVYLYGLKNVLALNDLSNAPDAILPGNF